MTLKSLLVVTHLLTALVAGIAVWGTDQIGQSVVVGVAVACASGWWLNLKLQQSLDALAATVRLDGPAADPQGIIEFDRLIEQLRDRILRWSDAASSAERGMHDVEQLVAQIERRSYDRASVNGRSPIAYLRRLLSGVMEVVQTNLNQLGHDAGELESKLSLLTTSTAEQAETVSRTTTYVEQLSLQFDSVAEATNAAQQEAQSSQESARAAQTLLNEHSQHIDELRLRMDGTERRLRALKDRSQSIEAIVAIIGDISSRTDLLALNASIESFRAGEQGRGFSVVADEVRKLAEQSAQSTREISTLIEAIQADADESARTIADQRNGMVAEVVRVGETSKRLNAIGVSCDASVSRLRDITQLAGQQLHLTQGLVTSVERISETNRNNRGQLDEANWTARSISKAVSSLDESLDALRSDEKPRSEPVRDSRPQRISSGEHTRPSADDRMEAPLSPVPQLSEQVAVVAEGGE